MKKTVLIALSICAMACAPKNTSDKNDIVANILKGEAGLDLTAMEWTREPESFEVKGDTIEIVTAPGTDLWQRTYYISSYAWNE